MSRTVIHLPAVALRGMTILPGMVAHFDISRDRSDVYKRQPCISRYLICR